MKRAVSKEDPEQSNKRVQTSYHEASTLKELSRDELSKLAGSTDIANRTSSMEQLAKSNAIFTSNELDDVVHSLQHLTPADASTGIDWDKMRQVLEEVAHISHKDWAVTTSNALKLSPFLIPDSNDGFPSTLSASRYHRILRDGKWHQAVSSTTQKAPWAVLVTGVNGLRKTTSLYQPWWSSLLHEALVRPPTGDDDTSSEEEITEQELPSGNNSFFRQLDHMIATLCNKDFSLLYALAEKQLVASEAPDGPPSAEIVQSYSNLKAAIFARFRTLSELLGVLLLQQAQKINLSCLMETSGRDVAMFKYVDHVFSPKYRKLVLHFVVNDLTHAQASVDRRMVEEIQAGRNAIQQTTKASGHRIDIQKVVDANAGGPYGSDVLPGVQEASDKVWETVLDGSAGVGEDWFKATIQINAHATEPWTAQAVRPDGSLGKAHTFEQQP